MRIVLFQVILIIFACIAGYISYIPVWFGYHPLFMSLGYILLMGNAISLEKFGVNNWSHMILQLICLLFVDFAFYVIWTNKNTYNKSHLTSYHSWFGIAVLILNNLVAFGSINSMWPAKTPQQRKDDKKLHILAGKAIFSIAMAVVCSGFYKIGYIKFINKIWIILGCIFIGLYLATKTIKIPVLSKKIISF